MSLRASVVVLSVLLLAGCTPASPAPTASPGASVAAETTPTASSTPPPAARQKVNAADYLISGTPFVPDEDGLWSGHYAFFTDETKTVRCDIYIFSGDSGGAICATTAGNQGLVTYPLPAAQCDPSTSNPFDGYSVGINFKVFDTGNAGYTGCGVGDFFATAPGNELPLPLVLHDDQILVVDAPPYQYTCAVSAGVAACTDSYSGASITYGLTQAGFVG
jgi:hypothetical protein